MQNLILVDELPRGGIRYSKKHEIFLIRLAEQWQSFSWILWISDVRDCQENSILVLWCAYFCGRRYVRIRISRSASMPTPAPESATTAQKANGIRQPPRWTSQFVLQALGRSTTISLSADKASTLPSQRFRVS